MPRHFNTAGPCKPDLHYMLPAATRIPGAMDLIETQSYFVIHAPRQSGKTTAVMELAAELNASGRYVAIVLSVETGVPFEAVDQAEGAILAAWKVSLRSQLSPELALPDIPDTEPGGGIGEVLSFWSVNCQRPLVVFLDEVDGLAPGVLSSVLRQVRSGFPGRPKGFPHSLALVGLRDVRDYVLAAGGTGRSGAGSPFNIRAESVTLSSFTRAEIATLYGQHTADTGQAFTDGAIDRVFECTNGQPWLVNALVREVIKVKPPSAAAPTIDADDIDRAREMLILRRDTHLDSLAVRLSEPRVRAIVEAILSGGYPSGVSSEDLRYVEELGLIRKSAQGSMEFANPIYREVVPRALAYATQAMFPAFGPTWLTAQGTIDATRLMAGFVAFWRLHGEPLMRNVEYHEVAPQLVLMAFLHRVVNGGATIDREFAVGSGRIDLCVRGSGLTMALELKVWRDRGADPLVAGLEQIDRYLERLGLQQGFMDIFDRRTGEVDRGENGATSAAKSAGGRETSVVRLH